MTKQKFNLSPENIFLIAGLGNPGEKYSKTRHNAGFLFLDFLADQVGETWTENKKLKCQLIKKGNLILAKPTTFMNNSGQAIEVIMSYYKMLNKKMGFKIKDSDYSNKLLIVHDEIDIDFEKYKVSINSRSAGHNGVESIINHLKSRNFARLRIGIKSDLLNHIKGREFVLKNFSKDELDLLNTQNQDIKRIYFQ